MENNSISMDSPEDFQEKILNYYSDKDCLGNYENETHDLSIALASYFHNQYSEFRIMYPKSVKRYSNLKLKDLENPITHDFIISFLKKNYSENYRALCSCLFNLSDIEFLSYEKRRDNFQDMF